MDIEKIKQIAINEIKEEEFKEAGEAYKKKLRAKKWWHILFPFKIIFIRRED